MFTLLAAVISRKINESRVLSAAWKMREDRSWRISL
jgi:hypothetical protein